MSCVRFYCLSNDVITIHQCYGDRQIDRPTDMGSWDRCGMLCYAIKEHVAEKKLPVHNFHNCNQLTPMHCAMLPHAESHPNLRACCIQSWTPSVIGDNRRSTLKALGYVHRRRQVFADTLTDNCHTCTVSV